MDRTKRKMILGAWISVLSLICLTTATYAWMSISNSIRVSDLELNVVTENAMEIAPDKNGKPGEWTTILSLGDLIGPETVLRPVTWSAQEGKFYSVRYGLDGRPGDLEELTEEQLRGGIRSAEETQNADNETQAPDAAEAEAEVQDRYLIAVDLWMRTGASQATVFLTEPVERTTDVLGAGTWVIGEPVWNANTLRHDNGGNGAEAVVRIGFRTYEEEYDTGGFVIYEPNAQENETPTIGTDGTALEGEGRLIRQGVTTWQEQNPILRDHVTYEIGRFFQEDNSVFALYGGQPRKFTLYIWLEGQDSGCDNTITQGRLSANLQFAAVTGDERENIYRPE